MVLPWNRLAETRSNFCNRRKCDPEDDVAFLGNLNCELTNEQSRLALEIRNALALECSVPAAYIHSNDKIGEIAVLLGVEGIVGWLFFEKYHGDDLLSPIKRYLARSAICYSEMDRQDVPSIYFLLSIDSTVREWVLTVITEICIFHKRRMSQGALQHQVQ